MFHWRATRATSGVAATGRESHIGRCACATGTGYPSLSSLYVATDQAACLIVPAKVRHVSPCKVERKLVGWTNP